MTLTDILKKISNDKEMLPESDVIISECIKVVAFDNKASEEYFDNKYDTVERSFLERNKEVTPKLIIKANKMALSSIISYCKSFCFEDALIKYIQINGTNGVKNIAALIN